VPGASIRIGLVTLVALAACVQPSTTEIPTDATREEDGMELRSEAFGEGEAIPSAHTCDGGDTSPPLSWEEAPEGTAAFALIVDDPDARGFVHWVLTDIPGDQTDLPAGEGDSIGVPGRNDFGRIGWGGPCPPSGEHRYVFTLVALSAPLGLAGTVDADAVRTAMAGTALAEAKLTGVYRRGG
jgi:Raf kinase inhibitor-like YbhB/YbcL family protein